MLLGGASFLAKCEVRDAYSGGACIKKHVIKHFKMRQKMMVSDDHYTKSLSNPSNPNFWIKIVIVKVILTCDSLIRSTRIHSVHKDVQFSDLYVSRCLKSLVRAPKTILSQRPALTKR